MAIAEDIPFLEHNDFPGPSTFVSSGDESFPQAYLVLEESTLTEYQESNRIDTKDSFGHHMINCKA